ncbi:MAG: hypothetical protein RLZZ419_432 [Pseudomonadota bacterium]
MKNFKKQTLAIIGGLTMIMNAGVVLSSTTNASAIIDWNTFTITGYGFGFNSAPTYTLSGQSSNTYSNVSDWLNWSSDTLNNSYSFGASTTGTAPGAGSANASRSANLNILGTGFLMITANYTINAAINENNGYSYDPNYANASASFNLSNPSSLNTSSTSASQANISLGNQWSHGNSILTYDQKQGTLAVGVIVNTGDILSFSSAVSASAHDNGVAPAILPGALTAVPVPAAVWLFSSALVGLIGLGRRRQTVIA